MLPKKDLSDYRLENYDADENSYKIRTVYTGPNFAFKDGVHSSPELKRNMVLLEGLCCLLFAGGLFINGSLPRRFYVIFPYFCAMLPHAYIWMALGTIKPGETGFTRRQKSRGYDRLRGGSLLAFIFSAAASVGGVIAFLVPGREILLPWDMAFFILTVLQTGLCLVLLITGRGFEMVELISGVQSDVEINKRSND